MSHVVVFFPPFSFFKNFFLFYCSVSIHVPSKKMRIVSIKNLYFRLVHFELYVTARTVCREIRGPFFLRHSFSHFRTSSPDYQSVGKTLGGLCTPVHFVSDGFVLRQNLRSCRPPFRLTNFHRSFHSRKKKERKDRHRSTCNRSRAI